MKEKWTDKIRNYWEERKENLAIYAGLSMIFISGFGFGLKVGKMYGYGEGCTSATAEFIKRQGGNK